MNTELNNRLNGKNGVYYEYRETFYRVTSSGQEVETSRRETSDNCEALIRMAFKTSSNFVDQRCVCSYHWDTVSVIVIRFDGNGRKVLFETNLFASDFAE